MSLLAAYLRPEWARALILVLLLLVGIGLQLANPQIVRIFIDEAQRGEPVERLVWIALLFLGIAVSTQLATIAETYVAETLGWRTTNALRADLTRHVLQLDATFHAEHTAGELIERIDGDVSAIADFFARFVVQVLGNGLFLVGVLLLLTGQDWRIGALLAVCATAALVFMSRRGGFVAVRSRAAREAAADLSSYIEERLGGLLDIKSNGADEHVMRGLVVRLANRFRSVESSVMAGSIFNAIVGLLLVLGTAAALGLSAALYGTGGMTLGSVYVVFRYTSMLRTPLERLARQMNTLQTATGAVVRIGELMATQARVSDGPEHALPMGALSVELERVSFAYARDSVLDDVSFRLEPEAVVGVLGRTGSGKTTIARMLFRLHDPTYGVVRLGGVDIRRSRLASLRSRIGLVTQDVQLIHASLRDNMTLFDTRISDAQLLGVFAQLGLDDWLRGLPRGLDTLVGVGDRGLSAGEAQLVALARVFLEDPGLIVLDEPSSRLDPLTERRLERGVSRLLAGRTAVVIAHRLATVERADWILILDNGRVAEFGRRIELAADPSSRFAKLLRAGLAEELA